MRAGGDDRLGEIVESYRLLSVLGVGGTSVVYLGQRVDDAQAFVAIKVLAPQELPGATDRAAFRVRFLREARAVTRLRHEHILPVLSYGEIDELTYMVLPAVRGGTLASRLNKQSSMPLTAVAEYIRQVASALDYAHHQGIVHRDVKPSNILLDARDHTYLTDFGIARIFDAGSDTLTHESTVTLTHTGQVLGTPYYMAPEQIQGERVSPATDIYAVGIVLFELVTGEVPFHGDTPLIVAIQHLQSTPYAPSQVRHELPPAAEAAILRALAKQPGDRFPTVGALAQAFATGLTAQRTWHRGWAAPDVSATRPINVPYGSPLSNPSYPSYPSYPTGDVPPQDHATPPGGTLPSDPMLPARSLAGGARVPVPSGVARQARMRTTGSSQRRANGMPIRRSKGAPRMFFTSTEVSPQSTAPTAVGTRESEEPRGSMDGRTRLALFGATVTLLLIAAVAAIALRPAPAGRTSPRSGGTQHTAHATATHTPGATTPSSPSAQPVIAGDVARASGPSAALTTQPGQHVLLHLTFVNTGQTTWSAAGGYALACDTAAHPVASCLGNSGLGFGAFTVAPGHDFLFTLELTAPTTPGTYTTWWNIAHNGTLFGSPDVQANVLVVSAPQPTATTDVDPTATPRPTPTVTPQPTATAQPTVTPTPLPTVTPSPQPSATATNHSSSSTTP